jgi:CheY-like chemotaxis protein
MVKRLRILVGDPCRDTVESLAVLLSLWGHRVRTALDGPSALDAAALFHPEVVLLEIALPWMNGCEVARRFSLQPDPSRPLLVAITGYSTEPYRRQIWEAGFDYHLVKPVDPRVLQTLMARRSGPRKARRVQKSVARDKVDSPQCIETVA